jgi:hypothetical protein
MQPQTSSTSVTLANDIPTPHHQSGQPHHQITPLQNISHGVSQNHGWNVPHNPHLHMQSPHSYQGPPHLNYPVNHQSGLCQTPTSSYPQSQLERSRNPADARSVLNYMSHMQNQQNLVMSNIAYQLDKANF